MAFDNANSLSESGIGNPVDSSKKIPPKYPEMKRPGSGGGGGPQPPVVETGGGEGGFFSIYKKGQGYWTRLGTAIGAAIIGILAAVFAYDQLFSSNLVGRSAAMGIAGIVLAIYAGVVFWLTNKPRNVDFLIATDSEMKKVNWTSRKELIGSTKVVILFMFFIAIALFVIDVLFGYFFQLIKVLETGPFG